MVLAEAIVALQGKGLLLEMVDGMRRHWREAFDRIRD